MLVLIPSFCSSQRHQPSQSGGGKGASYLPELIPKPSARNFERHCSNGRFNMALGPASSYSVHERLEHEHDSGAGTGIVGRGRPPCIDSKATQ